MDRNANENQERIPKITIVVSVNKSAAVIENEILKPLYKHDIMGALPDNDIDYEIVHSYYWAWKHIDADYYGFMQYRRYFNFTDQLYPYGQTIKEWGQVSEDRLTEDMLEKYGWDEETIRSCVCGYDIITPNLIDISHKPWYKGKSLLEQYGVCHNIEDMHCVLEIIRVHFPDYYSIAQEVLNGNCGYFTNLFIMKKDIFYRYCEWMFAIFSEFEKERPIRFRHYSKYQTRVPGFLIERLFNVFYHYERIHHPDLKTKELQVVFFRNTEKEIKILPPAYEKNFVTVLTAAKEDRIFAVSTWLQSIIDNSSEAHNYDVIITEGNLSNKSRRILAKMVAGRENFSLRFFDTSLRLKQLGQENLSECFDSGKLLAAEICADIPKAVWLDSNVIAERDIYDLQEEDIESYDLAAVRDIQMAAKINESLNSHESQIGNVMSLEEPYDYFQSGVMVLNLEKIRKRNIAIEFSANAEKADRQRSVSDILNHLYHGSVKFLPSNWNMMVFGHRSLEAFAPAAFKNEYDTARKDPWIVNFWEALPLFVPNIDCFSYFWKYAKKSPYYELMLFEMVKRGKIDPELGAGM